MTSSDFDGFRMEFARLSAALETRRETPQERNVRADAYFHVLKRFTLDEVIAKADRWLAKETRFPKPVEWGGVMIAGTLELPELTGVEAREWLAAEKAAWEGQRCSCALCRQAGLTELQVLRFVPDIDSAGRDRRVRIGERVVVTGHWAHGQELAGYYRAKGAFYAKMFDLFGARTAKRLDRGLRQVGEEPRQPRKASDFALVNDL